MTITGPTLGSAGLGGSGLGGANLAKAEAEFTGALDLITTEAYEAWSMYRRLRAGYTGPLCRLLRVDDDAEMDFGVGADNLLDTSAIVSWLGSSSGLVRTIYGQMLVDDFEQSTKASMPDFSLTGYNVSIPAAVFIPGDTHWMQANTASAPFSGDDVGITCYGAYQYYTMPSAATFTVLEASHTGLFSTRQHTPFRINEDGGGADSISVKRGNTGGAVTVRHSITDTNPHVHSFRNNGTTLDYFIDSTEEQNGTAFDADSVELNQLTLGASSRGVTTPNAQFLHGAVAEIIIYDSVLSDEDFATIRNE